MKTIDFSKVVTTINGQPFKDENGADLKIGICISQILTNAVSDEASRAVNLAKKITLCKSKTELEPHDVEYVKKVVTDPKNRSINIVQSQIEELLS